MEDLEAGTIRNTAVKANRDGENPVRMLDVEMSSPSDVQSVQSVSIGGVDFHPLPGAKVVVAQVGGAWKMAIVLEDGLTPSAGAGEKFLYSQDSGGALAALIKLRNDSTMELNGDADFAVAFNDLKTAFDQLKSDYDALVTAYNAHIHITTATVTEGPPPVIGVISPTVSTGTPTTANIDPAKVATVKLP
jgi:hypothetical protein